jgi:hypothetical protein
MKRRVPFLVLAGFATFWFGFFALSSPIFGGTDVFIFRDASCNCTAHLGFVTSSAPTHPAYIPPVLFADYTPGTLIAFAPVASIFGCTSSAHTYYELLLLLLIAGFVLAFIPDDHQHRGQRICAALIAGITLPVGLFETGADRPEPVAIVIFFALLTLWRRMRSVLGRAIIIGLAGALFLVHPYIGIAAYLSFLLLAFCSPGISGRMKIVVASFAIAAASVLAWALILHHADATSLQRFMEHALGAKSGAGVVLKGGSDAGNHGGALHSYLAIFKKYADKSNRLRGTAIFVLLISFVVLGSVTARIGDRDHRRQSLGALLALFCILALFPAAIFAGQVNYFIASEAMLFGAIAVGGYALSDEIRRGRVLILILAICAIAALPGLAIQVLRGVETRASFKRAVAQETRVKQFFHDRGLDEPRILIDAAHYFIYKPDFHYLYDSAYFSPEDSLTDFDALVRCYMTHPAFSRSELTWEKPFNPQDWALVDGDVYPQAVTLFGHRLMRNNWSWSCDVYARKEPRQ